MDPSAPDNNSTSTTVPNDDICVVYYDLETSGFHKTADILQIAANCGDSSFSGYINPTQKISTKASEANGLTSLDGKLLLNGNPVASEPLQIVFHKFLSFLTTLQRRCVLCAHNGHNFDAPRLIRTINTLGMKPQFDNIIHGFADTLPMVREINGRERNSLTGLASSLEISTAGAHNAVNDVDMLQKMVEKLGISETDIIGKSGKWEFFMEKEVRAERVADILKTLAPLEGYVSVGMRKRMAEAGISYDLLVITFCREQADGVTRLLGADENGQIRVTKSSRVINRIMDFLNQLM